MRSLFYWVSVPAGDWGVRYDAESKEQVLQFWKRPSTILGVSVAVGAIVFLAVFRINQAKDALASGVTAATFVVLCWYTWETQKLRKSAEKQIDIATKQIAVSLDQLRASRGQLVESQRQYDLAQGQLAESQIQTENANTPIVMAHFELHRSPTESRDDIVFHNIGTAPAFSVTVEPGLSGTTRIGLQSIAVVPIGAMVKTKIALVNSDGTAYRDCSTLNELVNQWRDVELPEPIALKILYSRADGATYETVCRARVPLKYESFEFVSFRKVP